MIAQGKLYPMNLYVSRILCAQKTGELTEEGRSCTIISEISTFGFCKGDVTTASWFFEPSSIEQLFGFYFRIDGLIGFFCKG